MIPISAQPSEPSPGGAATSALFVLPFWIGVVSCTAVVSEDAYRFDCDKPGGFGEGRSCYSCPVTEKDSDFDRHLLNACTTGDFKVFDNKRVPPKDVRTLGEMADPVEPATTAPGTNAMACNDPSLPTVYIVGSNVLLPVVTYAAQQLAEEVQPPPDGPMTVVFSNSTDCGGVRLLRNDSEISGQAARWSADRKLGPLPCLIPPRTRVDIAITTAFASWCGPDKDLPAGLEDNRGAVEALAFVAPLSSRESAISAEAVMNVYGFGEDGGVKPWTDASHLFHRGPLSAAQGLVAKVVGLPADLKWQGTAEPVTTSLLEKIAARDSAGGATADSTLGFASFASVVAGDFASRVKMLAFQAREQRAAFWPGSTANEKDMRNVREGRYPLWTPYHLYTRVPPGPGVRRVVNAMTGSSPPVIRLYAQLGLVPQCAMKVELDRQGSMLKPFTGPSCGCFFDKLIKKQTCQECSDSSECPAGARFCNRWGQDGFCEAKPL